MKNLERKNELKPLIKYPGGKENELKSFKNLYPKKINRFIEPFIGGGAVFFNSNEMGLDSYHINDKSNDLYELYNQYKNNQEELYRILTKMMNKWEAIKEMKPQLKQLTDIYKSYSKNQDDKQLTESIDNFTTENMEIFKSLEIEEFNADNTLIAEIKRVSKGKIKRTAKLESKKETTPSEESSLLDATILTILKGSFYMYIRGAYNNSKVTKTSRVALYFFIREFCFQSMFRFSKDGKFNVAYGGNSYNNKNIMNKVKRFNCKEYSELFNKTEIHNLDFDAFLNQVSPKKDDFIFLDPPYDSEFSEYDKNSFGKEDHIRLAKKLNETDANIMVVIKNTDFIWDLYNRPDFNFKVSSFNKNYQLNYKSRNDRKVKHLVITNY